MSFGIIVQPFMVTFEPFQWTLPNAKIVFTIMILQLDFLCSSSKYDIDNLFFIVNYYLLFALFIIDVFINYIIILTEIINSIKSMILSWIFLASIKTLMMPKYNFLYYKKFNPIHEIMWINYLLYIHSNTKSTFLQVTRNSFFQRSSRGIHFFHWASSRDYKFGIIPRWST
jgi:hypothetical protein